MCTKCNHFKNLSLRKCSALNLCASSPARQQNLFGCPKQTLTVDFHIQLSLPIYWHIWFEETWDQPLVYCPHPSPSSPQALRHSLFKGIMYIPSILQCRPACRRHSLYVCWVCWIWALFTLSHLVPLLQCILRSCFPVARSYLNMRLFFYLHSCLAVGFFSVLYLKINCCYLNFASMWNIKLYQLLIYPEEILVNFGFQMLALN